MDGFDFLFQRIVLPVADTQSADFKFAKVSFTGFSKAGALFLNVSGETQVIYSARAVLPL